MKKLYFIALSVLTLAGACRQNKSGDNQQTARQPLLKYKNQLFNKADKGCNTQNPVACSHLQIVYPVFKSQPALNDTLRRRAASIFSIMETGKTDTSLAQLADDFFSAQKITAANRKQPINYSLDLTVTVAQLTPELAGLQYEGETYQGGAHGNMQLIFLNWDIARAMPIHLNDLLTENGKQQINAVAEKIFRQQEYLSPAASLKDKYFFKGDKFSLNDNFLITPKGLQFVYNQYEIKPYVFGTTSLFIPYAQIRSLLKPNTVISQYQF